MASIAPNRLRAEIDRQHDVRAHRAAQRDRNRIDDASVDEIATLVRHRLKKAGHGDGSADRSRYLALAQPDFLTGMEVGRDRGKRHVQFGKLAFHELLAKDFPDALAFDHAAAQTEIHQLEHALPVERKRPALELIE